MSILAHWFTPETMQALSWTLLHFLWQGAALAALLWLLMTMLRNANFRYAASVIVLLLMLAAPVCTFLMLQSKGSSTSDSPVAMQSGQLSPFGTEGTVVKQEDTGSASEISISPWLVEVWLLGVVALSLRSIGGLLLLGRLRRQSAHSLEATLRSTCLTLQRRLGVRRLIEFCESREINAPAVIGWFRPVVLLPIAAIAGLSQQQLEAVIAHELAHIKRLDAFVNAFQIFVETVLFYHPAVWWVSGRIRAEREHCCDDAAVAICGDRLEYARALTIMAGWRSTPRLALAANGGSLSARVKRLLGMETLQGTRAVGLAVVLVCLGVALIASTALLDIAPKAAAAEPVLQTDAPSQTASQGTSANVNPNPTPQSKPSPEVVQQRQATAQTEEEKSSGSYIDGLKAAGLANLDVDQLVAFKVQGVTPEYVRELRASGVELTPGQVIAFKVQDVTPEYVREMKALGQQIEPNNLIAMKVQDITPEYVRAMHAAGLTFDTGKLIGMKVQDITPGYIQQLQKLGFNPSADEAISMKVQDITPEYVQGMRATGLSPTINQLIAMKVQDITPDYVRALQQLGLKLGPMDSSRQSTGHHARIHRARTTSRLP